MYLEELLKDRDIPYSEIRPVAITCIQKSILIAVGRMHTMVDTHTCSHTKLWMKAHFDNIIAVFVSEAVAPFPKLFKVQAQGDESGETLEPYPAGPFNISTPQMRRIRVSLAELLREAHKIIVYIFLPRTSKWAKIARHLWRSYTRRCSKCIQKHCGSWKHERHNTVAQQAAFVRCPVRVACCIHTPTLRQLRVSITISLKALRAITPIWIFSSYKKTTKTTSAGADFKIYCNLAVDT